MQLELSMPEFLILQDHNFCCLSRRSRGFYCLQHAAASHLEHVSCTSGSQSVILVPATSISAGDFIELQTLKPYCCLWTRDPAICFNEPSSLIKSKCSKVRADTLMVGESLLCTSKSRNGGISKFSCTSLKLWLQNADSIRPGLRIYFKWKISAYILENANSHPVRIINEKFEVTVTTGLSS